MQNGGETSRCPKKGDLLICKGGIEACRTKVSFKGLCCVNTKVPFFKAMESKVEVFPTARRLLKTLRGTRGIRSLLNP